MNYLVTLLLISFLFLSCKEQSGDNNFESGDTKCRGEWSERDENNNLKKYIEYWHTGIGNCLREPLPLSQWEKSNEKRSEKVITCEPQVDLPSMWLKSNSNYYSYRNERIYIELNSETGVGKRLLIGELESGEKSYIRQEFCFYLRSDLEDEPVNPQDYGNMILFDLEYSASSSLFTPMEIYNYSENLDGLNLLKMDNNYGVDWSWCPSESTPWGFCDELRNGNIMFFPEINDPTIQNQLEAEAKLIRSEFNFVKITKEEFTLSWENSISNLIEVGTQEYIKKGGVWRYLVMTIFDEPLFVGRAWREYLRKERPFMPDVEWAMSGSFPIVCYKTHKEITLSSGEKSYIMGEACYNNGVYEFTEY